MLEGGAMKQAEELNVMEVLQAMVGVEKLMQDYNRISERYPNHVSLETIIRRATNLDGVFGLDSTTDGSGKYCYTFDIVGDYIEYLGLSCA